MIKFLQNNGWWVVALILLLTVLGVAVDGVVTFLAKWRIAFG